MAATSKGRGNSGQRQRFSDRRHDRFSVIDNQNQLPNLRNGSVRPIDYIASYAAGVWPRLPKVLL